MNCAEFETLLSDYIDGTLGASARSEMEQHAAECSACREFMSDVAGAQAYLKRAVPVLPPAELVTRIAYQAPLGRSRPEETEGVWSKLSAAWFQLLRPRFAMGMAMTILSFAMLQRCTGIQVQHIQAADLSPVRIWDGVEDRALRTKDRAIKYYENIRLVYTIETRFRELQEQQEAAGDGQTPPPSASGKKESSGGRAVPNRMDRQQGEKKQ